MLVLSRKANEGICVGNNIEIVVLSIYDDRVRLGIKAPKDVSVHRAEIASRIKNEQPEDDSCKASLAPTCCPELAPLAATSRLECCGLAGR